MRMSVGVGPFRFYGGNRHKSNAPSRALVRSTKQAVKLADLKAAHSRKLAEMEELRADMETAQRLASEAKHLAEEQIRLAEDAGPKSPKGQEYLRMADESIDMSSNAQSTALLAKQALDVAYNEANLISDKAIAL